MPKFIQDTTHREFYCLDETENPTLVMKITSPTARIQITSEIHMSMKHAYQSPNVLNSDSDIPIYPLHPDRISSDPDFEQ